MTKELAAKKVDQETLDGLEDADYDIAQANKVVDTLNKKTGSKVTVGDFAQWLNGTGKGSVDKFDAAVVKLIGQDARDEGEQLARLESLVLYALGLGIDKVGGISMKTILQNNPKSKSAKTAAKAPSKSAKPAKDNSPKIKEIKAAMRKLSQMKSVKTYIGLAKKLQKLQG